MYLGYFKIKIIKSDRQLSMQVLEMDEGLRGKGSIFENKKYQFCISSYAQPALYNNEICLRGVNKYYDYDVDTKGFQSNRERNKYLSRLTKCIDAYKKSLKKN